MSPTSPGAQSIPNALTHWLGDIGDFVILRNEENWIEHLQRGGDLDVLVGNLEFAEAMLIRHLGVPLRVLRSSYVTGYSYDWGHVDLLPRLEWRGASFLQTDAVFGGRRLSKRGLPVPRPAHEAVTSWLTSLLFGGFFKERYAATIRDAIERDADALREALTEAAGPRWGERLWRAALEGTPSDSAAWTRSVRRAVWTRAWFRSPLRTTIGWVAYVVAELKLRLRPPTPWVVIGGADVDAVPLLAREVIDRFTKCRYATVQACSFPPCLESDASRAAGSTAGAGGAGPSSGLSLALHWLVAYWSRLVHLRAKGYILVGNRVDPEPALERKSGGHRTTPRLGPLTTRWLPRPDIVFHVAARASAMDRVLAEDRAAVQHLDGMLPPAVLADEVQCVTRAWMFDRSLALLADSAPATITQSSVPTQAVERR
jgi:hypothetical protein